MSFDRYLAVTKAFDSRKWLVSLRSPTASYIISAVGWIVSALLCVQLYRYSQITPCNTCEYIFPFQTPQISSQLLPAKTEMAIEKAESETGFIPQGSNIILSNYFSNFVGLSDEETVLVFECLKIPNATIPGCIDNVTMSEPEAPSQPDPITPCK